MSGFQLVLEVLQSAKTFCHFEKTSYLFYSCPPEVEFILQDVALELADLLGKHHREQSRFYVNFSTHPRHKQISKSSHYCKFADVCIHCHINHLLSNQFGVATSVPTEKCLPDIDDFLWFDSCLQNFGLHL